MNGTWMMSKPSWAIEDKDLWRAVAAIHEAKGGCTPSSAWDRVILEWLSQGDAKPLVSAINAGHRPGYDVLKLIADMLNGDDSLPYHLIVRGKRGAHDKPGKAWRELLIANEYEKQLELIGSSDKAFEATADKLGMSISAVRIAVTAHRELRRRAQTSSNK